MKCHIPQISWHNRDPVLSVDFQPSQKGIRRIATAGTDTHVLIWLLNISNDGANIDLECVADLSRHSKTVNVVRFSPNGEILASADDEAAIILWRNQPRVEGDIFADDDTVVNKENWTALKVLRGHIDDISDLCWAPDSQFLVTGSVDNTAIMWDVTKGKNLGLLTDHKGFVQGVAWDPLGQYIATLCSDRSLRLFNMTTKKVVHRVQRAVLPNNNNTSATNNSNKDTSENTPKATRIFYDDTLKSFSRRLTFSPCGKLLFAPTGIIEENEGKFTNATYVFTRNNFSKPVLCLPTGEKFTLAVRCCPTLFKFRVDPKKQGSDANSTDEHQSLFSLPYRIVFAVATQDSILFYDSQQALPFAKVSNIHYTRLCDLTWSSDGKILMASSTDGYCSFVLFSDNELGVLYVPDAPQEEPTRDAKQSSQVASPEAKDNSMDWTLVLEADTNECPDGEKPHLGAVQPPAGQDVQQISEELSETQISTNVKSSNTANKGENNTSNVEKNSSTSKSSNMPLNKVKTNDQTTNKADKKDGKGHRRIQFVTLSSTVKKN